MIPFKHFFFNAFVVATLFSISPLYAENFQKILECDNGQVWVDVDRDQRQQIQLVVRNREANRFFHHQGVGGIASSIGGTDFEWT